MSASCIDYTDPYNPAVEVDGRRFNLRERAAWQDRPRNQPPLFLSADAARVLAWAMTLPDRPDISPRRPAASFSPAEAMDHFYGPRKDADKAYCAARRAWWEAVHTELNAGNLLFNYSYGGYKVTDIARTFYSETSAPLVRPY